MEWKKGKTRVSSFSLPVVGGGLGWERVPSDRDVIERLAIRLGERGALSAPYEWEDEEYLNRSVIEIRSMLTDALSVLEPGGGPFRMVEQLRAGCGTFLRKSRHPRRDATGLRPEVAAALAKLRESFRVTFAYAAVAGGIDVAAELARAIPEELSAGPLGQVQRELDVPPPGGSDQD